jgi:hypothetical protein
VRDVLNRDWAGDPTGHNGLAGALSTVLNQLPQLLLEYQRGDRTALWNFPISDKVKRRSCPCTKLKASIHKTAPIGTTAQASLATRHEYAARPARVSSRRGK